MIPVFNFIDKHIGFASSYLVSKQISTITLPIIYNHLEETIIT